MKKFIIAILLVIGLFGVQNFAQKSTHLHKTPYVLHGDGEQDDTKALNAWGRGEKVLYKGKILGNILQNGRFLITWGVDFNRRNSIVRHNVFVVRYTGYDSVDILHYGRGVRHKANKVTYDTAQLRKVLQVQAVILATQRKLIELRDEQVAVLNQIITIHKEMELTLLQKQKQKERDNRRKSLLNYLLFYKLRLL